VVTKSAMNYITGIVKKWYHSAAVVLKYAMLMQIRAVTVLKPKTVVLR